MPIFAHRGAGTMRAPTRDSAWWMQKAYGELKGTLVSTESAWSTQADAIASFFNGKMDRAAHESASHEKGTGEPPGTGRAGRGSQGPRGWPGAEARILVGSYSQYTSGGMPYHTYHTSLAPCARHFGVDLADFLFYEGVAVPRRWLCSRMHHGTPA